MSTPPTPPPMAGTKPDPRHYQQGGCGALLLFYAIYFGVATPLIMFGWNVGLENAGIVSNQIAWSTALGLAVCLMLVRGVLAAVGRSRA